MAMSTSYAYADDVVEQIIVYGKIWNDNVLYIHTWKEVSAIGKALLTHKAQNKKDAKNVGKVILKR